MKAVVHYLLVLLVSFSTAPSLAQTSGGRPTLLIASQADHQFEPGGFFRASNGLPAELADQIAVQFSQDRRFELVERQAFRRVVEEQNFSREQESRYSSSVDAAIAELDGLEDMSLGSAATFAVIGLGAAQADVFEAISDRGQSVGARYVLLGSLQQDERTQRARIPGSQRSISGTSLSIRLRLRLVDTEQGTLIGATSFNGVLRMSDGAPDWSVPASFAADFVRDVVYPINILSLDPLTISRGANSGLVVGDEVLIERIGGAVIDQGIEIGRHAEVVGSAQVAAVDRNFATLTADFPLSSSGDYRVTLNASGGGDEQQSDDGSVVLALGQLAVAPGAQVSDRLRLRIPAIKDSVERQLVAMPGVVVADRNNLPATLDELSLQDVLSGDVDYSQITGADYLLVGTFDELSFEQETRQVRALGRTESQLIGAAIARFELLDVRRGVISQSSLVEFRSDDLRGQAEFENALGMEIVREIGTTLFPAEVIGALSAREFYINQGHDWGVQIGDRFEVVREGDEMRDSSGRSFGAVQIVTAETEVVRVEDQRAVISLIEGDVAVGQLVRRSSEAVVDEREAPSRRPEW
ncbi:hypothetical protein [Maricaulis sp. MIT060901]|uniref:hypothetical protein n=1 Tax=Maricaulis sp. MIT060901 TaxID=3096993 RepID=UPI00399C303E